MKYEEHVREVIEQHNENLVRWYANGEIDSVAAVFAEDAWQMIPNSAPLSGRAATRAFWRTAVQWGKWEFELDTQSVEASEPIAIERGKYTLKFTAGPAAPAGMTSFEDRGSYLRHWRYEADEQWRIAAGAAVSELPPRPPEQGD